MKVADFSKEETRATVFRAKRELREQHVILDEYPTIDMKLKNAARAPACTKLKNAARAPACTKLYKEG